jgi:hypothetical protein
MDFRSHERLAQVIVDKIKAKYFGEDKIAVDEKRVTGIGLFFKSKFKNWLLGMANT